MSSYGQGDGSGDMSSTLPPTIDDLPAYNGSMSQMMDFDGDMMNAIDMGLLPMNYLGSMSGNHSNDLYGSINDSGSNQQQYTLHTQQQVQKQQSSQSDQQHHPQDQEIASDDTAALSMTAAGAGPLPQGFGNQVSNGGGSSILTEFTKRRNWSQRVLEELRDFLHILTSDGRFLYVSPSCKVLTGWDQSQLVGKFIGDFIHNDDSGFFVREFNESIATGNALRFFYRFKKSDGSFTIFEAHGHPHLSSEATGYSSQSTTNFCRGFFLMSRPYPTKNTELLDSFLEHKTENERLMKRIAALKEEEQQDDAESRASILRKTETGESGSASPYYNTGNDTPLYGQASNQSPSYGSMPPPAIPKSSDTALTTQNLKEANASSKPDSINDKMARYEGANYIEGIEMMTGLRYRDGERSKGISTGDISPALIRGDAGIAIPQDKDNRMSGDKKKKLKAADEYVCTDCGTLDSPEWRKGPQGPKTLCNACGLRWAKKEKKRQSTGGGNSPVNGM